MAAFDSIPQPVAYLNHSQVQDTSIVSLSPDLRSLCVYLVYGSLASYLILSIWSDYKLFLSLGPGGVPSTPLGYVKVSLLRLIALDKLSCLRGPRVWSAGNLGYFNQKDLPPRSRERPQVVGIVPHRQITQRITIQEVQAFRSQMEKIAKDKPGSLCIGRSIVEKHIPAMLFTPQIQTPAKEVAHMHDIDGSMHLELHPADATLVIEQAWGERHPLCGKTLPAGFIMIYAPRGKEEAETLLSIVKAAVWWSSQSEETTMECCEAKI